MTCLSATIGPSCVATFHADVQSIKDMPILQDVAPPGGFPAIRFDRRLPSTGPTGVTIFAVGGAVMAYGYYRVRRAVAAATGAGTGRRHERSSAPSTALSQLTQAFHCCALAGCRCTL